MKNIIKLSILLLLFSAVSIHAQTFSFVRTSPAIVDTSFTDSLGGEIVSYAYLNNLTNQNINVFLTRTVNNIPSGWESAFCFSVCLPPFIDTMRVTDIQPGSHEVSVHFYPYINPGTGYVTIKAALLSPPYDTVTVTFGGRYNPIGIKQLSEVVEGFKLNQNYPNPFNPNTKIGFAIPKAGYVDLRVYDILGREVKVLLSQQLSTGEYEVEFDAKNFASGMYYYRLQTEDNVSVKKMTLVK